VNEKKGQAKLREIEEAMKSFPKEVRRQERAYRAELKIRKAFGKISLEPEPKKAKRK
jgi:hypothetical protein